MKSQHVEQIECDVLGKIIGWGERGLTGIGEQKIKRKNTKSFPTSVKMSL